MRVVLPEGKELDDASLEEVHGKWGWAFFGAALNIAAGHLEKRVTGEKYTWKDALIDGVAGAAGMGVGKLAGRVGRVIERTLWVPKQTPEVFEMTGSALGTGAARKAVKRHAGSR